MKNRINKAVMDMKDYILPMEWAAGACAVTVFLLMTLLTLVGLLEQTHAIGFIQGAAFMAIASGMYIVGKRRVLKLEPVSILTVFERRQG